MRSTSASGDSSVGHLGARRDTPRAKAAVPPQPGPVLHHHRYHGQRDSLQTRKTQAENIKNEQIWMHLRPPSNNASRWVRALDRCRPTFRRLGAIYGVLDAYRESSVDEYPQSCHHMTLLRSPVSSRDLAKIWVLSCFLAL